MIPNPTLVLLIVVSVNCVYTLECLGPGNCTSNSPEQNEDLHIKTPYIREITDHTSKPHEKPKVLSMLSEDHDLHAIPTTVPSTSTESRGRALDFSVEDRNNGLVNNTKFKEDLSDVSMDNDEEDNEPFHTSTATTLKATKDITLAICEKGGLTYDNGEKLEVGCDSICTCTNGKMDCVDRCKSPFIRKGKKINDPFCKEKPTEDHCCSVLQCATDTETEPLEMCTYKNKTYNRGDKIQEGCLEVCSCEAGGKLACKPRCAPTTKTSEKCLEIPDMNDPCCKTVVCDVTLKDNKLIAAKYINSTTIKFEFDTKIETNQTLPLIDISDNKATWKTFTPLSGGYLTNVDGNYKYAKIENTDDIIEIQNYDDVKKYKPKMGKGCEYKSKQYKLEEEFHDGCESFCVCKESGVKCLKLECPTYFGTDVLDPNCIEWETVPSNFTPMPPKCCPEKLRCKNNGSCVYKGETYQNWQQVSTNVTGCEKRCYCEMGKVECQNICPPVTALPPNNLECPHQHATLSHLPGDDCCVYWMCNVKEDYNGTKTKITGVKEKNTTDNDRITPFVPLPTKTPSKILGPLLVYSNSENSSNTHKQILTPDENHYYTNNKTKKVEPNFSDNLPPFLGPVNPNYKPNMKPAKVKPTKGFFVTPPTLVNQIPENNVPNKDILHLLQQHPEIANFPHGSVLEIQNIPQRPEHLNPNSIFSANHPYMPYGLPENSNRNPTYPQNPIYMNNGQLMLTHLNGSPQQNLTGLGHPALFPGGFPNHPGYQQPHDDINVHILDALDAHTIRLAFTVPTVIVGLHGRVEVRYTHKDNDDPNSWELQVFAPPNDLIATPQLEFDLVDLKADTEYKIKITITLRDLHNTPTSRIYTIRTLREIPSSTFPPMIPIEPNMVILDVNSTWVNVAWRKFTEYELQFIDGVQLRFKEIDGKIYAATPLIHRAVTSYTLENLKPNTKYEIGIFFIPFPGQHTELHAEHMLYFTTANEVDTYGFNVTLEISLIKATNIEISWSGVPYPEDKYVNIYRAIYQSDSGKGDSSTFKVAKRDSPSKSTILDLKPGTRYRLWLEIYLTNGKIKTSNVQDFITKPRSAPQLGASSKQDKLSGELPEERGDYYGPLVIVAILAAIAILSTLVLLLILVRRHSQNKACITPPPRVSQSAYDNPTYKVEIQQETMDL